MSLPTLRDAALAYSTRGFRVIPLHNPVRQQTIRCSCGNASAAHARFIGKHPRLADWPQGATTDGAQITQWWTRWPQANIGLVTGGASGLAILDVDPRNGGDTSLEDLERLHHPLPNTPLVLSGGGGQHYYFATTQDLPCPKLAPGLDFLGDGGHYALAPPSLHLSGNLYVFEMSATLEETRLEPVPEWLLALILAMAKTYTQAASRLPDEFPEIELDALRVSARMKRVIAEGDDKERPYPSRSEAIFAVIHALLRAGYEDATIAAVLLDARYAISQKPLEQKNPRSPDYWQMTVGWVAKEIGRAKSKKTWNDPRATDTGGPRAQEPQPHEPQPHEPPTAGRFATLFAQTDHGNANALGHAYGHRLRYSYEWKHWLWWTEHAWGQATREVMAAAQQTIKRLATQVETMDDRDAIAALLRHLKSSLSTTRLKAMIEQAQALPGIAVTPDQLDAHPWLLNGSNGTMELDTMTLREHRREDLLTKCLTIPYDPDAHCPTWETFLWRIMGGSTPSAGEADLSAAHLDARQAADDRASRLMTFLQRAVGYSLTGDTREQCLFLLHGSGDNGKSTFLETLQALLGPYAESTPAESFLSRNRTESVNNDIAKLRGARLVTAVEIGENTRLNEALIKRLTGQDTMTARFLFQEFFDFKPTFKLFLAFNHLPVIKDTGHAMWRRVKLIPFTVTIPKAEQDQTLREKLQRELPGILAWAVRGCHDWFHEGLTEPQEVTAATQAYRTDMDTFGRFLEEECLLTPEARVKASLLYRTYQDWCERHGEPYAPQRSFGMYLSQKGLERYTNNGIWWRGLGVHASPTERTERTEP